jgi:dipeptidyl aminopeptidase/acylaminoacyl peptidase
MTPRPTSRRTVLLAALAAGLTTGCDTSRAARTAPSAAPPSFDPATWTPPAYDVAALRAEFRYDAGAPPAVAVAATEQAGGVRVERVTFAHPLGGDPVSAYRVAPVRPRGPLALVGYGHGGGAGAVQFLEEAREVAAAGAVVLLAEAPFAGFSGDTARDEQMFRRAVVAARRALDVAAATPGADPSRAAYLGHSWGATLAALLAGVEPRLAAVVMMATGGRLSSFAVPQAARRPDARLYLDAMARYDAINYVRAGGRRQLLLQTGTRDPRLPAEEVRTFLAAMTGRTTHRAYDTGHDVDADAGARTDRIAFLSGVIGLDR